MWDANPVAFTSEARCDAATGEDYDAVKEFAVVELTNDLYSYIGDHFGDRWLSTYPQATYVILGRSWRTYPNGRRNTHDWAIFSLADDRADALDQIAWSHTTSGKDGSRSHLRPTKGCVEMAAVLEGMERDRIEEQARKVAKLEAAKQAVAKLNHEAASATAFARMRDGSKSGKALAKRWNSWIRRAVDNPGALECLRNNLTVMTLYDAVMAATEVQQKRKAIQLLLDQAP